jgi:hypothetical protein
MLAAKKQFRVYARGHVYLFDTQADLGKWLMSPKADEQLGFGSCSDGDSHRFYFLDDNLRIEYPSGKTAGVGFLIECLYSAVNRRHAEVAAWSKRWQKGSFPGAKRSRHRGSSYRHMHTQAERCLNALVLADEAEPAVRAARTPHALPTCWDDYARSRPRSWKDHRMTQYKRPTPSARNAAIYADEATPAEEC